MELPKFLYNKFIEKGMMKIGYCYFCYHNFLGWLFDLQKVQTTACALHGRYYHDVYRCYAGTRQQQAP